MREKFELAGIIGLLGTILAGFATFLNWSGIAGEAASHGAAVKELFWVVTMGALMPMLGLGVLDLAEKVAM